MCCTKGVSEINDSIKFNCRNPFSPQVLLLSLSLLLAIDGKPLIGLGLLGAAALLGGVRGGIQVGGGGGYGGGQPAPEHHHTTHYQTVEHRPMYVHQPPQYHTYETRTIEYQKWWRSLWSVFVCNVTIQCTYKCNCVVQGNSVWLFEK